MSDFIAVETNAQIEEHLQCLSTEVMQWSKNIVLFDMRKFTRFWDLQASQRGITLTDVLKKTLSFYFGIQEQDEKKMESHSTTPADKQKIFTTQPLKNVITFSPGYRAARATNPWQAVLLLEQMRYRGRWGLLSNDSRAGRQFFKNISWTLWWECISQLKSKLIETKIKGFRESLFSGQCKRLERASDRLGFESPSKMEILNPKGVKSRYGKTLSDIWTWTYGEATRFKAPCRSYGFPWQQTVFSLPTSVQQTLDLPLVSWNSIPPFLIISLDKLRRLNINSGLGVIRLNWALTFEDCSTAEVPILFRNPYDLSSERGAYPTALLQAELSFSKMLQQKYKAAGIDLEHHNVPFAIHSWQLTIEESMTLPNVMFDFFSLTSEESDLNTLFKLENELPVSLHGYQTVADWMPEDSFTSLSIKSLLAYNTEENLPIAFNAVAAQRPLYIFSEPTPIQLEKNARLIFLESLTTKWWASDQEKFQERHYYKYLDSENRVLWIFKTDSEKWYQHGIFG